MKINSLSNSSLVHLQGPMNTHKNERRKVSIRSANVRLSGGTRFKYLVTLTGITVATCKQLRVI